ncbi:MAG TPA: Hsp70 family protein [Thermoanaerobaculia bacterium]|nr:Hsp70 family protein [Thermoanaerobaculia bacterium]
MHVGIDLGTTNSVLATFDGDAMTVVPNGQGEVLTPSVVRIDGRGAELVGRRAFRFLETDPGNTRGEFKRLMGTEERLRFEASGRSFLPEELSAKVLASLLADAEAVLGYRPAAAVVSTPALFELPQNHATMKAGKLAGLAEVTLIQEPIASAIAAGWRVDAEGFWLVYDLGGGTLDVSLLETRDGWLRVVDHGGDNFLGGKDFDSALTDWAAVRLAAETGLPPLSRTDPAHRRRLSKLKAACEQAKIDLSRLERTSIVCAEVFSDPQGHPVDADLPVSRAELEGLVMPLVERSLDVCRSVLEKNRLGPDAVGRVVFVGGPTLMPALRQRVGGFFGGRMAEGIDPMTIVARGAALYAATVGLEARPAAPVLPTGLVVRMEHPAVTADTEPFMVGRFLPERGEQLPVRVRIAREDGGFESGDVEVSGEGAFVIQVRLERHRQNRFRLSAWGAGGREVALRSPEIAIVHGVSIADPPLARSVGVARSDDTVLVYFEKGTPLPARRTAIHKTVQRVPAGSAEDALAIPVIQGEFSRAHLNRLIGSLQIQGGRLKRNLPAGSRVEVTLQLDRSGQLHARADLPEVGESFEDVVHVLVPTASPEVLEKELEATQQRVAEVRRRGFASGRPALVRTMKGAADLLAEARAGLEAARGGDADAAARVHRLLLDLDGALEQTETELDWPTLESESSEEIESALSWIWDFGTPAERQLCDSALAAVAEARQSRDAAALDRQVRVLRSLSHAAFVRDPKSVFRVFDWYQGRAAEATDPRQAQALVEQGRRLAKKGDAEGLRQVNRQLGELFPGTADDRRRSFGSGVR